MSTNAFPRQEFEFSISVQEEGRVYMRALDKINVDDIVLHLVRSEIHEVMTGDDLGNEVPREYKDFLIKERFSGV